MRLSSTALLLPLLGATSAPARTMGSCVRLDKAGTQVRGDVKICPGRYRIPDRGETGVIVIIASDTRVDLTGVTLESPDSVPALFTGIGIASRGVDSVVIRGGTVRGFRYGILLEGGRGHRVSGVDLSSSRAQVLRSTETTFDEADWLDIFHPDTFETYGAGIYLRHTQGASITGIIARGSQNGIGLFESRDAWIADNDVSGNSGWGIHLWKSSGNTIIRNKADHNVRCESPAYRRGCDSAALLLREASDSNLVADNDLSSSGDGFFLSGQRGEVAPSVGNIVVRNDASHAWHNGFESTFSSWNSFLENRADSADYGFWLGYSRGNLVRGNVVFGSRTAAIAIEHGSENDLSENTIVGGPTGILLFTRAPGDDPSTVYRISDNTFAKVGQGVVLRHTTHARISGNRFDGVVDGLVVDSAGADAAVTGNVFLSASRWFIDAVRLEAGDNYWGVKDLDAARGKVRGEVELKPFLPAEAAGF
ncbi:MAG TPA: NosD domain-containing protein [Gemmatimonadales bacterium]|nr:NosD domain-containing protein [Gemmatimonadales bacterium]